MAKVKQLTVSLENQAGRLAAVAKALAAAKVNIEAILAVTAGAQGSAQLVVDNVAKAKKALSAAQFAYTEGTLDRVELPNKAGALADCGKVGQKRRKNRRSVWHRTQRCEEISAVACNLKTSRAIEKSRSVAATEVLVLLQCAEYEDGCVA